MSTYHHGGEREAALAALTDTDVLVLFRDALVRLYPILTRLQCLQADTQPYDDFDTIADVLWQVLVVRTLAWRDGISGGVHLPTYGFYSPDAPATGYIQVRAASTAPFRFVEFIGDRRFGPEPFNAVGGVTTSGDTVCVPLNPELRFSWAR